MVCVRTRMPLRSLSGAIGFEIEVLALCPKGETRSSILGPYRESSLGRSGKGNAAIGTDGPGVFSLWGSILGSIERSLAPLSSVSGVAVWWGLPREGTFRRKAVTQTRVEPMAIESDP